LKLFNQLFATAALLFREKRRRMSANRKAVFDSGWHPNGDQEGWERWKGLSEREAFRAMAYHLWSDLSLLRRGPLPREEFWIDDESRATLQKLRRGGILLSAHYGCHELVAREVAATGAKLLSSALPMKSSIAERWLALRRQRWQTPAIELKGRIAEALDHLRGGGVFGVMIDQDPMRSGERTFFLGVEAERTRLADLLWKRTKTPTVVFGIAITGATEQGEMRELRFRTIDPSKGSPTEQAQQYLEESIGQRPELWYGWIHRRYKSIHPELYSRSTLN